MAPSTMFLAYALAVGAAAVALAPRAAQDPYCSEISRYATDFPTQSSAASSYCTSYFHVTTSTSTATQTITAKATATATSTSMITITPTSTAVTGSQTCFQNTAVASPAMKNKRGTPQQSQQSQASAQASSYISSACSCFGVNLAPKTTARAFTTTTQFVTTTTAVTTATSIAPAVTTNVESTSYYTHSGTYVAQDGGVYTEYDGFDFYGNDLYSGLCDGSSGGYVNTVSPFHPFKDIRALGHMYTNTLPSPSAASHAPASSRARTSARSTMTRTLHRDPPSRCARALHTVFRTRSAT